MYDEQPLLLVPWNTNTHVAQFFSDLSTSLTVSPFHKFKKKVWRMFLRRNSPLKAAAKSNTTFSIMSYNLLAPIYVRPVDKRTGKIQEFAAFRWVEDDDVLDAEKRQRKLRQQIQDSEADIICLQEVQFVHNTVEKRWQLPLYLQTLKDFKSVLPCDKDLDVLVQFSLCLFRTTRTTRTTSRQSEIFVFWTNMHRLQMQFYFDTLDFKWYLRFRLEISVSRPRFVMSQQKERNYLYVSLSLKKKDSITGVSQDYHLFIAHWIVTEFLEHTHTHTLEPTGCVSSSWCYRPVRSSRLRSARISLALFTLIHPYRSLILTTQNLNSRAANTGINVLLHFENVYKISKSLGVEVRCLRVIWIRSSVREHHVPQCVETRSNRVWKCSARSVFRERRAQVCDNSHVPR